MTCAELANADTARYTCAQFIGIIDRSRRKPGILRQSPGILRQKLAKRFLKSRGRKVRDVMTAKDLIIAKPTTPLRGIAAALEKNRIKRVPVVAKGQLVGIVSRANIIQALAGLREEPAPATTSDSVIRKKVMKQIKSGKWSKGSLLNVTVQGGKVQLWGVVDSEAEKEAARLAAELVEDVKTIENNVIVLPVVAGS